MKTMTALNSRLIKKPQRNGKILVTIVVDYQDPNGKWKQRAKTTGFTPGEYGRSKKKEVEAMRQSFVAEVAGSLKYLSISNQDASNLTVFQYLDLFQEERRRKICQLHYERGYSFIAKFRRFFNEVIGCDDLSIAKLTFHLLNQYFTYEERRPGYNCEHINSTTLRSIMVYFKSAFKKAYLTHLIPNDITQSIVMPKIARFQARYLNQQDLIKLVTADIQNRLDAIVILDVLTGLRRSEILGLKYRDIDANIGSIRVTRSVQYLHGKFIVDNNLKTQSSRRLLPYTDKVREIVDWLKNNAEQPNADGFICVDEYGSLYMPNRISKHVHRLCKRLGISDCHFHGLRHSCATAMLTSGANLKIAQQMLGHSSISVTGNLYSHIDFEQIKAAAIIRDNLLK